MIFQSQVKMCWRGVSMDVLRSSTDISLNLSARNDDEARQTSELHKLVTPPPLPAPDWPLLRWPLVTALLSRCSPVI